MKRFSWRAVSESSEKFSQQLLGKALIQFFSSCIGFLARPILLLHVVVFVRRGYMDFLEAGNNCGLLHSCGRMCNAEP